MALAAGLFRRACPVPWSGGERPASSQAGLDLPTVALGARPLLDTALLPLCLVQFLGLPQARCPVTVGPHRAWGHTEDELEPKQYRPATPSFAMAFFVSRVV